MMTVRQGWPTGFTMGTIKKKVERRVPIFRKIYSFILEMFNCAKPIWLIENEYML